MLKKIPNETRKKLAGRGYYPQDGYILQYLPVPPNCLSVPEISDGVTVMSSVRPQAHVQVGGRLAAAGFLFNFSNILLLIVLLLDLTNNLLLCCYLGSSCFNAEENS